MKTKEEWNKGHERGEIITLPYYLNSRTGTKTEIKWTKNSGKQYIILHCPLLMFGSWEVRKTNRFGRVE